MAGSKKTKVKTKNAKTRKRNFRADSKVNAWAQGIDWEVWKEEFFTDFDDDGTFLYKDIWDFSRSKTKDYEERQWINKAIGNTPHKMITWQGDWFGEREGQRNMYSKTTLELAKKIEKEVDILDRAKVVAASYAPWNHRVEDLVKEVDQFLGGRVFLKHKHGLSSKEKRIWNIQQKNRFNFYIKGLAKVLDLKMKIDNQYLKSIGYDRPQLIQFIAAQIAASNNPQLPTGSEGIGQPQLVSETGVMNVLSMAVSNIVSKSKAYDLELPDELAAMRDVTPVKPNGKAHDDDDSSEG